MLNSKLRYLRLWMYFAIEQMVKCYESIRSRFYLKYLSMKPFQAFYET